MRGGASYRGQPLVALMFVLGGWVAMRAVMWDAAAFAPDDPVSFGMVASQASDVAGRGATLPDLVVADKAASRLAPGQFPDGPGRDGYRTGPAYAALAHAPVDMARLAKAPPRWRLSPLRQAVAMPRGSVAGSATHQLMWMAAISHLPMPVMALVPQRRAVAAPFYPMGREPVQRLNRWSADGWLMLRGGKGAGLAGAAAPTSYGASQAGTVLRYRLAPSSGHRPAAYLRATTALNGIDDRQLALGLSARPLAGLPVSVAAELRATDQGRAARLRPAVFAVTELPPVTLPGGIRAEAYGQAGYVGGRQATGFVDGQLRADRRISGIALARSGEADLRAGAGIWGGAQKGARRLDVGPTATLGLGLGGSAAARVAVDWRFRVAGNAAPSSGPAITLSAGF